MRRPSSSVTVMRAAGHLDGVAHRGQRAERGQDVARDGLVRALGQLEAGLLGELVQVEQAVDLDVAGRAAGWRWSCSTSYSSVMSPISSSTRSSSVTMPAVPPYSSTTMARWARSRRISDSEESTVLLIGRYFTGRLIWPTGTEPWPRRGRAGPGRARSRSRCRRCPGRPAAASAARPRRWRRPRRPACPRPGRPTSVRGTSTSRICRLPASKTSPTMCRSSWLSVWAPVTRSRSSSSVMAWRPSRGIAAEQRRRPGWCTWSAARPPAGPARRSGPAAARPAAPARSPAAARSAWARARPGPG